LFSLSGATITTRIIFDHETTPTRGLRVRVVDSGGQSFEQDLVVTITDVDEPTALVDDIFIVVEDSGANTLAVLDNDDDPDGPLHVVSVTQPTSGAVTIAGDLLSVSYTPKPNDCNSPPSTAPDTFSYTVDTGASADVAVAIVCVDDPGTAVDDTAAVAAGDPPLAIDVLDNDLDVDGKGPIIAVTQPDEGTVVITDDGAGLSYEPAALPTETTEVFTYTLRGGSVGTVTVTVTLVAFGSDRLEPAGACVHGTRIDAGALAASCDCDDGWEGARCDTDIDECATDNGGCVEGCINGEGSDDCQFLVGCTRDCPVIVQGCPPEGWEELAAGECPPMTACTDPDNPSEGYCTCEAAGWAEEDDDDGCADIDECVRGLIEVPTRGICVNTYGGAYIECPDDMVLSDDETTCLELDE
jgi:hypothetical protein